jgi:predicted nucleotidyltransferase
MEMMQDMLKNDARLNMIADRIVSAFHPRRIVLFGSRARGEARPDSDYDIFIEMETDKRPVERMREVSELFGLRDWAMDVIVHTADEVNRLKHMKGRVVYEIEREGLLLYERPD